jgi:hypothetical protein
MPALAAGATGRPTPTPRRCLNQELHEAVDRGAPGFLTERWQQQDPFVRGGDVLDRPGIAALINHCLA